MSTNKRIKQAAAEVAGAQNLQHLVNKATIAKMLSMKIRGVECLVARRVIPVIRISRRCVRFDPVSVRESLRAYEIRPIGR
jgi:hypothetical protein